MALFANPVKEYNDILNLLASDKSGKNEVYQQLLSKETNVLDTINRVANTKQKMDFQSTLFYNMSLIHLIAVFGNTWKNIFQELVIERRFKETLLILTMGERKIHLGIMIVILSIFLFLIDSSS